MHDYPKIHIGCAVCGGKYNLKGFPSKVIVELNEDLLIRDMWMQETDDIQDMRAVNTDNTYYQSKPTEKCLEYAEKNNKKKYLNA